MSQTASYFLNNLMNFQLQNNLNEPALIQWWSFGTVVLLLFIKFKIISVLFKGRNQNKIVLKLHTIVGWICYWANTPCNGSKFCIIYHNRLATFWISMRMRSYPSNTDMAILRRNWPWIAPLLMRKSQKRLHAKSLKSHRTLISNNLH